MILLRWLAVSVAFLVAAIGVLWALGALHYDLPVANRAAVWIFTITVAVVVVFTEGSRRKLAGVFSVVALVLVWWLTLQPTNDAAWLPDVAQLAWAEVNGDEVTLHNVRNCDYRTETDYTPRWQTRTVRLSRITGIDLAINYWGSPWIAHPILSFQFTDTPPVCFSIETRKKSGQTYSAIGGLYRQFELIYIVADERDVIRLRTNFRKGEDVYLYRTTTSPAHARKRFLEYVSTMNAMRKTPRWYNAITTNCTTSIRTQHPAADRIPWDWRLLLNGKADELMFERGTIATAGLPFAELKERALINAAVRGADGAADFSRRIRENVPGMFRE